MKVVWGPVAGFAGSQVIGFVWYHHRVFGRSWMGMVHPGKTAKELSDSSGPALFVSMLGHAALSGVLYHVYLDHMGVKDMSTSLHAGLGISMIGALSEVCHVMFSHKPWKLFLIEQGFNTAVVLSISAGIGYFLVK